MKFTILLIITLTILTTNSLCQRNYFYDNLSNINNAPFAVIETDYGVIACGVSSELAPNSSGFIMGISNNGELKWENHTSYEKNSEERLMVIKYLEDTCYVFGTSDNHDHRSIILYKINPSNGVLYETTLLKIDQILGGDNLIEDALINEEGFLLASSGANSDTTSTDAQLIQIDKSGKLIWEIKYSFTSDSLDFFDQLIQLNTIENGYQLLMRSINAQNQTFYHLIELDKEFNTITFLNINSLLIPNSSGISSKSFVCAGKSYDERSILLFQKINKNPNPFKYTLELIEVLPNEVYDTFEIPSNINISHGKIFFQNKDEFVVLGEIETDLSFDLVSAHYHIESGMNWFRNYSLDNQNELFFCASKGLSEGFIMGGRNVNYVSGAPKFSSIIIKTDCQGQISNENNCSTEYYDGIQVFPNPSQDEIKIQSNIDLSPEDIYLEIKTLNGQVVWTETPRKKADHYVFKPKIEPGVYFLRLLKKDGELLHGQKIIRY